MATRIRALGTLRVEHEGRVLDRLPAKRLRCALLVYLAVEREATRDQVMGLLWPDRPPERARHLLNQTLYELRQELGDDWVRSTGEQLTVAPDVSIDVLDFTETSQAQLHDEALALYGGAFLEGARLGVTRAMEGWIDRQQARLTRLHRQARRGALDARVDAGALPEALAMARRWSELDPLDDEAQHRLIELLAATGDRSGALRQYERYVRLVERELELGPLDETRELVERIRHGEVGHRVGPQASEPRPAEAASRAAEAAAPATAADPPGPERRAEDRRRLPPGVRRLQRRRLVWRTVGYLATALVLLEGAALLVQAFEWPAVLLRALTLVLGFGALLVLGYGLVENERTRERFGWVEAMLLVAVLVFAGAAVTNVRQAPPDAAARAAGSGGLDARRIAVLYLDDLSPTRELSGLAAGFTEALIQELGQVRGLEVLSRTAVAPYRNRDVAYDSIVAQLAAGTLVEGSVIRLEDRIRVTVRLIDGATATHLLSAIVEAHPDSLTQLVEALPREVSRLLRKRLGEQIELRAGRLATESDEAWELVQRARQLIEDGQAVRWEDREPGLDLYERADSMLARAELLDPSWPEPTLRRAAVAAQRALALAPIPSTYEPASTEVALGHLERALDRFPDHPPALQEKGLLLFELAEVGHGDDVAGLYRQAEANLRRAVLLDPNLARAWWGLSRILRRQKSMAEAKQAAEHALEADAFLAHSTDELFYLFYVYFDAEEPQGARRWCDELGKRYPDTQHWGYCELQLMTSVDVFDPDVERAWFYADTIVALATEDAKPVYEAITSLYVAKVLVRAGQLDSARAVFRRTVPDPPPDWAVLDAAHYKVLLGEYDAALDYLELYRNWNPVRAQSLDQDWWFRPLHGHPRFRRLVGQETGPG